MADVRLFDKIRIGIAGPDEIREWSKRKDNSGAYIFYEVKKPETINYRTFKPERDGLFCERIFGPSKDWECSCGRYKKIKYKGIICERCGVEVTRSKVRRERMGIVELAAPVCHIWYLKGVPSPIALLLDLSPRNLEKVIYFASFIIIDIDAEQLAEKLPQIRDAVETEKLNIMKQMRELEFESVTRLTTEMRNNPEEYLDEQFVKERMKSAFDRIRAEYRDADDRLKDLDIAVDALSKLQRNDLIEEDKWRAISKMLDAVDRQLRSDLSSLVRANIGADAAKELLRRVDLDQLAKDLRHEIVTTTTAKRARAIKRLELVEALISSKAKPEWMILEVVPVISPELRPMVQLDGGRFATSDLNDLYRRIINRNNRLKRIMEIQAPESIINHEKRLLQEAVDALIDNGRRSRPVVGSNARPLKSLSDMLKGKEGRFRKNLLGKRVDYSGRSVIVVGPHLKLHQCGLPKEMALELFKPFVMKTLVEKKITQNIKTAKRMIERMHPAVWDGLEEVIAEHPVLLNRAPTLHRLGIQAFEPILVEGKAIQVHPLVCHAYNADFDGDQMAVHVPLSVEAQAEARVLMLSTQNLFSPADGKPTVSPIQDIVLGCYALTFEHKEGRARLQAQLDAFKKDPKKNPSPRVFNSIEEVLYVFDTVNEKERGFIINDPVQVRLTRPIFRASEEVAYRDPATGQEFYYETTKDDDGNETRELAPYEMEYETKIFIATPGQLIFNEILPFPMKFSDQFLNLELGKKNIADTIVACHKLVGKEGTIKLLDDMKDLGFTWATKYGLSIALTDMDPPKRREEILAEADAKSNRVDTQFRRGMLGFNEMQVELVKLWQQTYDDIGKELVSGMEQLNPLSIITVSGARGSVKQLSQLSGMRGLMMNQFNEVIYEMPVRNSFYRGLSMLEYFVTTHGARKGLADTALRTADAGYLTRRLCDVAQDVIIKRKDCETTDGVVVHRIYDEGEPIESMQERVYGRTSLSTIVDAKTKEVIVEYGELISEATAVRLGGLEKDYWNDLEGIEEEDKKQKVYDKYTKLGFTVTEHGQIGLKIRSPLTCELEQGICASCYGMDLSSKKLIEIGVAVGIIAAQSIGEPGTQLTMRTFHTGGVAGAKVIAGTNQYKTGKFIKQFMEDFSAATSTDQKDFDPTKLIENQESVIKGLMSRETAKEDSEPKKPVKVTKAATKALEKLDRDSQKLWDRSRKTFFYTWTGESSGIVRVEEIFEARKQPRGKAIICPVTGTVVEVQESSYGRWVVVEADIELGSPMRDAYIGDKQEWPTNDKGRYDAALERLISSKLNAPTIAALRKAGVETVRILYPILVPPLGRLPVSKGMKIIKGDPLTEGPLDPHEVLDLAGAAAVYDYFVENLQRVYKSQGVDIGDKHVEVIIRQMLRKRKVKEPGDTPFLPGQIVDRFRFQRETEKVKRMIGEGKKIKYKDPITGEDVERDPREATATWILLGITEASLATDSFLSAASFQKTTRVLTEAAVRGKQDMLVGLKENVIIGRLIPTGTGVRNYQDVGIEVDRSVSWAQQALNAIVEAGDMEIEDELNLPDVSLTELAEREDAALAVPESEVNE
ncbi:MAG: DNA-directed RNA polymerase subunit beta' [Fimbriimonadaceae bacterium]|nr:DNA-directed RNA polymerase subunit beta' [Fimbriimonadaceae bacterium]